MTFCNFKPYVLQLNGLLTQFAAAAIVQHPCVHLTSLLLSSKSAWKLGQRTGQISICVKIIWNECLVVKSFSSLLFLPSIFCICADIKMMKYNTYWKLSVRSIASLIYICYISKWQNCFSRVLYGTIASVTVQSAWSNHYYQART